MSIVVLLSFFVPTQKLAYGRYDSYKKKHEPKVNEAFTSQFFFKKPPLTPTHRGDLTINWTTLAFFFFFYFFSKPCLGVSLPI